MNLNLRWVCAMAVAGFAMWVTPASAQSYTFTNLGTLVDGWASAAYGINNLNQVVGQSVTSGNAIHPTLWNGTTASDLGLLGPNFSPYSLTGSAAAINNLGEVAGTAGAYGGSSGGAKWSGSTVTVMNNIAGGGMSSGAYAINNLGQVAGTAQAWIPQNNAWTYRAAVWNGATATDLGTLGGSHSTANGINDSGQVVGWSEMSGDVTRHAFLWNSGTLTDLGTLGGSWSYASAINSSGQVAGWANTSGDVNYRATVWNGTTATALGTLGGDYSSATAINGSGQVVGWAQIAGNQQHAALWNGTTAIDLNSFLDASTRNAGWVLTEAYGINDQGSIVGVTRNPFTGQQTAYVLAAVPEPETYAMLLAGLGLIGVVSRRRSIKSVVAGLPVS